MHIKFVESFLEVQKNVSTISYKGEGVRCFDQAADSSMVVGG